jgi:hypothetical protein
MLILVGRRHTDDPDGRVLIDQLPAWAVPHRLRAHRETLRRLGDVFKQLNVPFGKFAMDSLAMSCLAVKICGPFDDSTYGDLMGQLASFTAQRDMLAQRIKSVLAAAVDGQARDDSRGRTLVRSIPHGRRAVTRPVCDSTAPRDAPARGRGAPGSRHGTAGCPRNYVGTATSQTGRRAFIRR